MKRTITANLFAGLLITAGTATAAVPGIYATAATTTGSPMSIALTASGDYISQPDGASIYAWGYGCTTGSKPSVRTLPKVAGSGPAESCPLMQMPGPTLLVQEGQRVTVTLTNSLPAVAGNTSIIFSGLDVQATGAPGQHTAEATHAATATYTFTATKPGTYAYYSGTQSDLQIEMGLYGVVVVYPAAAPTGCSAGSYSLAASAYDRADTCFDREFLFQFAEMNSLVHDQVLTQVQACGTATVCPQALAAMEPYRANYFLVNGRSMPDLMDTPFASAYPHQPYNGNPQMHPGENMLMRVVGQGRWQHPFHFHGNHARVLARDGNLLLSPADLAGASGLAGPLLFTIPTVPGQSVDAIFSWTGKGLNWDVYNHVAGDTTTPCTPDANGYHSVKTDSNYGEWCADHGKPIPVAPPDPQIVANGQWYGGTPYIGLNGFTATNLPPGTLNQNPGAGYAYMWHSHNEREITTNDVFPGGMMMMMIVNPYTFFIDETL